MSSTAWSNAQHDLLAFVLDAGMQRETFDLHVRLQLVQQPIVRAIDEFVVEARRFGEVKAFLSEWPGIAERSLDATEVWQTLMRWLLYFAPDRYHHWTPNYSEMFQRRR
jgi:hypothetical protein